jgi:hexosaminidase
VLRFYENVFAEAPELFPSPFLHIGGDECAKDQWRASATAQARIKELGLAGEDEPQAGSSATSTAGSPPGAAASSAGTRS